MGAGDSYFHNCFFSLGYMLPYYLFLLPCPGSNYTDNINLRGSKIICVRPVKRVVNEISIDKSRVGRLLNIGGLKSRKIDYYCVMRGPN